MPYDPVSFPPAHGPTDWSAAWASALALGAAALAEGRVSAARGHYAAAVGAAETFPPGDLRRAEALGALADAERAAGHADRALRHRRRRLAQQTSVQGAAHPSVTRTLLALAEDAEQAGDEPAAARALRMVLRRSAVESRVARASRVAAYDLLGALSARTAGRLQAAGEVPAARRAWLRAARAYESAVAGADVDLGRIARDASAWPRMAARLRAYSSVLVRLGRPSDAAAHAARAVLISREAEVRHTAAGDRGATA